MSLPPSLPIDETLGDPSVRVDTIARIAWTDGRVSRLTSTFGGLRIPEDLVETEDDAYYATYPALRQMPALAQLLNGQSDSIDLQISGLPSEIAAIADEEAHLADGARINFGKVYWDKDWSRLGSPRWVWRGAGGTVSLRKTSGRLSGERASAATYAVGLSAGTRQIRRAGASLSYWTSAQHEILHPDDLFFRLINKLSLGYLKAWPKF